VTIEASDGSARQDESQGYSLEQVEELTGLPARTVRFYRQVGLIESPSRIGRRAFYDAEQLRRLRMIAELRERGLGLDAIAKILDDPVAEHRSLAVLLKIGDELRSPWTEDLATRMTEEEVLLTLGVSDRDALEVLEREGIVRRVPRSRPPAFEVPSVATLDLAAQLLAANLTIELGMGAWELMNEHLVELARALVALYNDFIGREFTTKVTPFEIMTAFRELRPVALSAVQLAFAQQIEQVLDEFVEKGGVFDVSNRMPKQPPEGSPA
jgi:DNA-binding transcriptional MerR regulator